MKNNFQNEEKLKGMTTKGEQNEVAKRLAKRDDNGIFYTEENPLVINDNTKILEIVKKDVENESLLDSEREIRIVFKDENGSKSKEPYTKDVNTMMSLEEFEEEVSKCSDEDEIDDLQM